MHICYLVSVLSILKSRKLLYAAGLFLLLTNTFAKWLVFAILLTANYGTDTANGAYSVSNYIIFVILCWLPFVCGDILLKKKGKDNDHYRLAFVIGYGIFYVFLLCTTTSPIAFTYILPIISLIVIFKDEKFMIYCAVANMLSLIASIAFHIFVLGTCWTAGPAR